MSSEVLIAVCCTLVLPRLRSVLEPLEPSCIVQDPARPQAIHEMIEHHQPEVLLLECDDAPTGCPHVLQQIRLRHPALPIILLSLKKTRGEVYAALTAGASGYVYLGDDLQDLPRMIDAVRVGNVQVSQSVLRFLLQTEVTPAAAAAGGAPLTAREHEVARLITNGHSSKEIAALLHISLRTVDSHRASIRKKLRVHRTAAIVRHSLRESAGE